jgi:hypothetical protein
MLRVGLGGFSLAAVCMLACAAVACGDDVQRGSGGGGVGAGNSTGGSATGGSAAGGSAAGGNAGGAVGSGGAETCSAGDACSSGVCAYDIDSCDPVAAGACVNGFTCDGPPTGPVCGCDGVVVEGDNAVCDQWAASAPYAPASLCAQGTFPCDVGLDCINNVDVCVLTAGGPAGSGTTVECVAVADLDSSCQGGIANCACLASASRFGCNGGSVCDCTSDANNQETMSIAQP